MINGRLSFFIGFSALLLIAPVICYVIWGEQLILQAYLGEEPDWLHKIIEILYPRFFAEKNRLELSFFLAKVNQLVLRYAIVLIVVCVCYSLYETSHNFRKRLSGFTEIKTSIHNVYILRILFFFILLVATRDVYQDLKALRHLSIFYSPVGILQLVHLPFPGQYASFLIYGILFLSSVLVIFGVRPVLFSVLAMGTFVIYQAYLYSFEKIDHGYAPFTYACMLFPFLLREREHAKKNDCIHFNSWSLQLILIITCLVYFLSGLEKILISGVGWLSPVTFKTYLLLHDTVIGKKVASVEFLVVLFPALALLLQLSFPLMLFFRGLKYLILPAGLLFHIGTVILFGISSFENPWLFNYIFFFDWSGIGARLSFLPPYFRT